MEITGFSKILRSAQGKHEFDLEAIIRFLLVHRFDNPGSKLPSVKKVISNNGYKKYTKIEKGSFITLNEEAIAQEALWDGFHGIAVSNDSELSISQALSRYRDLYHVEEAFRVVKCTLKTRPIFHRTPERIRECLKNTSILDSSSFALS